MTRHEAFGAVLGPLVQPVGWHDMARYFSSGLKGHLYLQRLWWAAVLLLSLRLDWANKGTELVNWAKSAG
jgi:hypothetical protein